MPGSRHRETYSGEEDKGRGVGTPDSWGGGCGDGELRSDGLTWGVGGAHFQERSEGQALLDFLSGQDQSLGAAWWGGVSCPLGGPPSPCSPVVGPALCFNG